MIIIIISIIIIIIIIIIIMIKKHQLKQINYSYWFLRSKNNFTLPQKTLTSYSVLTILSPLSTSPNEQKKSTATSESIPFFWCPSYRTEADLCFCDWETCLKSLFPFGRGCYLTFEPWTNTMISPFPHKPTLHMLYSPKWSCIHSIYTFVKLTI